MTREIPLTQGRVAVVDDEDYEWLSRHKWYCVAGRKQFYAIRTYCHDGIKSKLKMHRVIMGAYSGQLVDHIDGDGLNNTRANLRICDHTENMRNRMKHAKCSSRYKGVCRENSGWRACIAVNCQRIRIGHFDNELDAARAYDRAALTHFGQFARLNFPDEATQ